MNHGSVSRETTPNQMVNGINRLPSGRSFPDAEVPENHVENILDVHAAGEAAERAGGEAELLGEDIFARRFARSRGRARRRLPAAAAADARASPEPARASRDDRRRTPPAPRAGARCRAPVVDDTSKDPGLRFRRAATEIDLVAHHDQVRGHDRHGDRPAPPHRPPTTTRSAAAARARARATPSRSTGSSVSRMPAVSSSVTGRAVEIEMHLDHVAGGAGEGRDDRGFAPRDAIEQRRLAGIRRTRDRDHDAFAQTLAARGIGQRVRRSRSAARARPRAPAR